MSSRSYSVYFAILNVLETQYIMFINNDKHVAVFFLGCQGQYKYQINVSGFPTRIRESV